MTARDGKGVTGSGPARIEMKCIILDSGSKLLFFTLERTQLGQLEMLLGERDANQGDCEYNANDAVEDGEHESTQNEP